MAYFDEFVSNFDLNHLLGENENVQVPDPQERVKKSSLWLKSKIISSDMLIQNYLTKSEDYIQAVKAHSVTKEDLKHVCINYKEAMEKCEILENEKKMLLTNQEVLQNKATDAENKYNALISHTNQLKSLAKQLETEKEALLLEKQLEKGNEKKVILLQKEKEVLLNDITALKEVIQRKKKKGKHVKLLKKYGKQKTSNDSIMSTSDESDNESHNQHLIHEIHNYANPNSMSNLEQNFIDIDSDSSNGEVSVDTGRGSSRANSEKCLLSPDYFPPETPLKITRKDGEVKQVDVASSPIRMRQTVSVATSPIGLDYPGSLFEDLYGDHGAQDFDGPDYIIDDVPICGRTVTISETFVDACTSPIPKSPDFRNFVDAGTSPRPEKSLSLVHLEINKSNQDTIVFEKQKSRCSCGKQKSLVDAGTSPAPKLSDLHKFVDKATNTINNNEAINRDANCKRSIRKSLFTSRDDIVEINEGLKNKNESRNFSEKSTWTEIQLVDGCTSPVFKSTETTPFQNFNSLVTGKSCEKSATKSLGQKQSDQESSVTEENISRELYNGNSKYRNKSIHETQELISHEKVCLESHNSNNLLYENINDDEVQSILNVMRLHRDAISPIPKTPFKPQESQSTPYETLLNNYERSALKLDQIMNYMEDFRGQIIKNVTELRNKCSSDVSNEVSDGTNSVPIEMDKPKTNKEKKIPQQKQVTNSSQVIEVFEQNFIDTSDLSNKGGDITEDYTCNKTDETVTHAKTSINKEDSSSKPHQMTDRLTTENELNEVEESIIDTNDSEIMNITESHVEIVHSDMPVVKKNNDLKTKKKSKLEKLRNKLIPTSKIKSAIPFPAKHASKTHKIISKEITTPSLDHEIAYQKAVKVMAELKSNQLQEKIKVKSSTNQDEESAILEIKSNKIEFSSKPDLFVNLTSPRNCTRGQSKKEEDIAVSDPAQKQMAQENLRCIEKSPIRKGRKRVAANEVDNLQGSKRVLRSSNIYQTTNKIDLPIIAIDHVDNDNESANNCKFKESAEKFANLMEIESEHSINLNGAQSGSFDLIDADNESHISSTITQSNHIESAKSDQSVERVISLTEKPTIELNVLNQPYTSVYGKADTSDMIFSSVEAGSNINKSKEEQNNSSNITSNQLHDNQGIVEDSVKVLHSDLTKKNANNLMDLKCRGGIIGVKKPVVEVIPLENDVITNCKNSVINYNDLDIFTEHPDSGDNVHKVFTSINRHLKENILCSALDRYGVISVKYTAKKVPDTVTNSICQKIEDCIADIIASHKDQQRSKMDNLINSIRNYKTKFILSGLMKYLKDPTRKCELFNKVKSGPAPPMTNAEVILLYVIEHLNGSLPSGGFINRVWNNVEHALFQLNRAPHFDVIESMSHFYAVMCRYFRNKSRLRCFMLDAMYCLQFKAVPLIRQCLDVCPGVLPNAHEHMAKTSLVTCLVYLLHFYKCQDKYNRAQDIRTILYQKYSYRFSEWNETMILEIFRKAIMDLRGTHNDKKMLRLALIILCKRHGAKWCQANIIQNMLLPIIEKQEVPERIKQFCVLMLGPLLKPFPADRKAHCEIVINQLLQMLQQNPSHDIKEAIYSSLIFMNKHDPDRVVQALLAWNPKNISKDFEEILNDYVMEKPLTLWKKLVTKKPNVCT